jgi:hypothetical protein
VDGSSDPLAFGICLHVACPCLASLMVAGLGSLAGLGGRLLVEVFCASVGGRGVWLWAALEIVVMPEWIRFLACLL